MMNGTVIHVPPGKWQFLKTVDLTKVRTWDDIVRLGCVERIDRR